MPRRKKAHTWQQAWYVGSRDFHTVDIKTGREVIKVVARHRESHYLRDDVIKRLFEVEPGVWTLNDPVLVKSGVTTIPAPVVLPDPEPVVVEPPQLPPGPYIPPDTLTYGSTPTVGTVQYVGAQNPHSEEVDVGGFQNFIIGVVPGQILSLPEAVCSWLVGVEPNWWAPANGWTPPPPGPSTGLVASVFAAYTVVFGNGLVFADPTVGGSFAVTLPDAMTVTGLQVTVKHVGTANTVTIDPASGDTIDGASSYSLNPSAFVELFSDGTTRWKITSYPGGGGVNTVAAADDSITVGGTALAPTLQVTPDVFALTVSPSFTGAMQNTGGQFLHEIGGANPLGGNQLQFSTSNIQTGVSSAGQYAYNTSTLNTFQVMGYVNNTGTGPVVAGYFQGVGGHVWGLNTVAYSYGGSSAACIGVEADVGNYSTDSTTVNGTQSVTAGMTIALASTAGAAAGPGNMLHVPSSAVFSYTSVSGNTLVGCNLVFGTLTTLTNGDAVAYSVGGTATGYAAIAEGARAGGAPGNAAFQATGSSTADSWLYGLNLTNANTIVNSGIRLNGLNASQGINFNIGTYTQGILFSGTTATYAMQIQAGNYTTALYMGSVTASGPMININGGSATSGVAVQSATVTQGIVLSSLTATYALQVASGTYTDLIRFTAPAATNGINFSTATFTGAAIVLSDAHHIQFGISTGTKIGTGSTQKLALWGATPVVQPSTTGTSSGFTAGSGTGMTSTSTSTGGTGTNAYTFGDVVLALKQIGALKA